MYLSEIHKILNHPKPNNFQEKEITEFLYDSRKLIHPESSIFIAIKSQKNDGHNYIKDLYKKGVRYFITEEKVNLEDATFFQVDNSVNALQKIAAFHRKKFNYPVIGITGSNGKTIVKEWLNHVLKGKFKIVRSPQSFNSQIGVPISVLGMTEEHNLALFEAGISKEGEMQNLAGIIRPDIGVFTGLGTAHESGFKNEAQKRKEKYKLFQGAEKIYAQERESGSGLLLTTYGYSEGQALRVIQEADENEGLRIIAEYQGKPMSFWIPFKDSVSKENALLCCLVALELGLSEQEVNNGLLGLEPVAMRLELKEGINACTLVNDTYNIDVTSLLSSLEFMRVQAGSKRQTLILSDIPQSQSDAESLFQYLAKEIDEKYPLYRIIGIGESIKIWRRYLNDKIKFEYYYSTEAFLDQFQYESFYNEFILIKGARSFRFERIVSRLEKMAHRTVLEIHFNALKNNLEVYSAILPEGVKTMAMVKASAYGSGSVEVAKLLESQGVDYLAVAYTDEGIELRKAGVKAPILVLNPEPSNYEALSRYQLEPEIYSLQQLKGLALFAAQLTKPLPVHIKLDTGMKRLGIEESDIPELIRVFRKANFSLSSVFSHLSASESKEHDAFTKEQADRFEKMSTILLEELNPKALRHLLNSSGISRFAKKYAYDMVRLGIGLYGIDEVREIGEKLQMVSTLKATVSQIKELPAGTSVGYGRRGRGDQPSKIATVSIGYADGLPRKLGEGKFSLQIRGQKAPIRGSVCMDMCMVDITHIPEAREGDEVIIFQNQADVNALADCLETIPYEVLTLVSERVKRVYVLD